MITGGTTPSDGANVGEINENTKHGHLLELDKAAEFKVPPSLNAICWNLGPQAQRIVRVIRNIF